MIATQTCNDYLKTLHSQWLSSLDDLGQYLREIDVVTLELQKSVHEIEIQSDLILVRNAIMLEKNTVNDLRGEIMFFYKKSVINNKRNVTIHDVRENIVIREKIDKTGQSVMMLKYHVNKLLSLAS